MKRTSDNSKPISRHSTLILRSETIGLLASKQLLNVKGGQSGWSEVMDVCGQSETCQTGH
jgi:hypothetical protein